MKAKRNNWILLLVLAIFLIGVFFLVGTPHYQSIRIKTIDNQLFKNEIIKQSQLNLEIDIRECTDFDWDELYVFPPYYPTVYIFQEIGEEWTELRTYLGYLLLGAIEHDTVSEGQFLMVFKNEGKIILSDIYTRSETPIIFDHVLISYEPLKVDANEAEFFVTDEGGMFILTQK